jgi:hypothetical protein
MSILGGKELIWKIQPCEVTKRPPSRVVVCTSCVCLVREIPQEDISPADRDRCLPLLAPLAPKHATKAGCVRPQQSHVSEVLAIRRRSQIRPAVIELAAVDVVNLFVVRNRAHFAMHENQLTARSVRSPPLSHRITLGADAPPIREESMIANTPSRFVGMNWIDKISIASPAGSGGNIMPTRLAVATCVARA